VLQSSFRTKLFAVGVGVKTNKDELGTKGHKKVVVANNLIILIVADMCIFVCFDRQNGVVNVYAVINTSAVGAATPCKERLVVDKTFKFTVNGLAHHRLTALQFAVPVTPRIFGEVIDKAVNTVFVVIWTGVCKMACDTQ